MLLSAVDFLFCSVLRWVIEDRAGEVWSWIWRVAAYFSTSAVWLCDSRTMSDSQKE